MLQHQILIQGGANVSILNGANKTAYDDAVEGAQINGRNLPYKEIKAMLMSMALLFYSILICRYPSFVTILDPKEVLSKSSGSKSPRYDLFL